MLKNYKCLNIVFKTVTHVRESERESPFDSKTLLQEDSETSVVWDTGVWFTRMGKGKWEGAEQWVGLLQRVSALG